MPRKHPTERVDIIGKPDSVPLHDVSKFVESSLSCQLYSLIKTPAWDSVGDSLEDFYLGARFEHHAMLKQKAELQEHMRVQSISNKSRLHNVTHAQAELRNRFVSVNVFLREFEEKWKGALKNGIAELALHDELRASNSKTRIGRNELTEFRNKIKATTDEYEPYERVLDDVVAATPAFNSVKELMDRCDALMLVQVEISELSAKKIHELESMRKRLVEVANEAALKVLGLKNALSSVDRLYESARSNCLKWERTIQLSKDAITQGMLKKDIVREGINNLYRMLCQRRSMQGMLPYNAIGKRVSFILNEVELLREVLDNFRNNDEKAGEDTKPEILC